MQVQVQAVSGADGGRKLVWHAEAFAKKASEEGAEWATPRQIDQMA